MQVKHERYRKPDRPANTDDCMGSLLRVVDREPIMRTDGYLEGSLPKPSKGSTITWRESCVTGNTWSERVGRRNDMKFIVGAHRAESVLWGRNTIGTTWCKPVEDDRFALHGDTSVRGRSSTREVEFVGLNQGSLSYIWEIPVKRDAIPKTLPVQIFERGRYGRWCWIAQTTVRANFSYHSRVSMDWTNVEPERMLRIFQKRWTGQL